MNIAARNPDSVIDGVFIDNEWRPSASGETLPVIEDHHTAHDHMSKASPAAG